MFELASHLEIQTCLSYASLRALYGRKLTSTGTFDKEIEHSLRKHIMHLQIPRLAMMRAARDNLPGQKGATSLHTRLLASAIYNSSRNPSRSRLSQKKSRHEMPQMSHRIRNCVRIASTIDSPSEWSTQDLMRRLSTAASTSLWCLEYMYTPVYYTVAFGSHREGDACLEVALLVACGYSTQDVLDSMLRLARLGKLKHYRKGWVDQTEQLLRETGMRGLGGRHVVFGVGEKSCAGYGAEALTELELDAYGMLP